MKVINQVMHSLENYLSMHEHVAINRVFCPGTEMLTMLTHYLVCKLTKLDKIATAYSQIKIQFYFLKFNHFCSMDKQKETTVKSKKLLLRINLPSCLLHNQQPFNIWGNIFNFFSNPEMNWIVSVILSHLLCYLICSLTYIDWVS